MHYVYVIVSDNKRPYIGYSSDLRRRLEEHNTGKNASTRGSQWKLVYYEAFCSEEDARMREKKLKQDGRSRRFLYERIQKSFE